MFKSYSNEYAYMMLPTLTLLEFQVIELKMKEYLESPWGYQSSRSVRWYMDTYKEVLVEYRYNDFTGYKGYKLVNKVRI